MPARSLCWNLLTLQPDKMTVECNICKHRMSYNGASTSNLMRHLKVKHPKENDLEVQKKMQKLALKKEKKATISRAASGSSHSPATKTQPTRSQSLERTARYERDSIRKRKLDEDLLDLILIDMQPLSIVQQRGFRKFVNSLDSKYEIVSRKRLTQQLLPERYNKIKKVVIDELSQVKQISITTDCWTSRANEDYTTVTAHFLTLDWKLKKRVLMTWSAGKRCSAQTLATKLQQTLQEFSINGKVTTIVTDNAKKIEKAVEITKIRHLPCFAHTLNLTVRESIDAVEDIKFLLKKVRNIVTYFHSSTFATNSLREVLTSRGRKVRKLKQDVDNCWNSSYDMICSYLGQHEEVTTVLRLSGKMTLCLGESDVSEAKEAIEVLLPFYEAIKELSSEKSTSASKIIPLVKSLQKFTARGTSKLSKALNCSLYQRFDGVEDKTNLRLATLLDPRFKKTAFSTQESANSAVEKLKEVMRGIDLPSEQQDDDGSDDDDDDGYATPTKKQNVLWSDFDNETSHTERAAAKVISAGEIEIRQYLERKGIPRKMDPMAWWKDNAKALPRLELIARDVLAIPATSDPSERICSEDGELMSMRRAQLKKTTVDMIMFLNKNEYFPSTIDTMMEKDKGAVPQMLFVNEAYLHSQRSFPGIKTESESLTLDNQSSEDLVEIQGNSNLVKSHNASRSVPDSAVSNYDEIKSENEIKIEMDTNMSNDSGQIKDNCFQLPCPVKSEMASMDSLEIKLETDEESDVLFSDDCLSTSVDENLVSSHKTSQEFISEEAKYTFSMKEQLVLNSVFSTWTSFEKVFHDYCIKNNYVFVKKNAKTVETANKKVIKNKYPLDWRYKSIQLQCKHFGEKGDNGAAKKRETDTFKTGCTAHIKLHANKNLNGLVISHMNLEHKSHPAVCVNDVTAYPERRRLDTEQTTQMVALLNMKVQTTEICRYFLDTHKIPLRKRDVHNQRKKYAASLTFGLTNAEDQGHNVPVSSQVTQMSAEKRILSQTEKFKKANLKLKELAVVLSNRGQDEFDHHLNMLVGIVDAIKKGKSITWMECDASCPISGGTSNTSECPSVLSSVGPSSITSEDLSTFVTPEYPSVPISEGPSSVTSEFPSTVSSSECQATVVTSDGPSPSTLITSQVPNNVTSSEGPSAATALGCPSVAHRNCPKQRRLHLAKKRKIDSDVEV